MMTTEQVEQATHYALEQLTGNWYPLHRKMFEDIELGSDATIREIALAGSESSLVLGWLIKNHPTLVEDITGVLGDNSAFMNLLAESI